MDEALYHAFAEVGDTHWWFRGRRDVVAAAMASTVGPPAGNLQVFEVGCGAGAMHSVLGPYGPTHAIDMSADAVDYCAGRYAGVSVGQVPDDLPAPGSVDLVAAFDVIEHIDDDHGAVRAIHESLRPGGWFVCTVPAFQFLWSSHDEVNHHKRRYRRAQLRQLLMDSGFDVEKLTYFNSWLFPAVVAARMLSRLRHREAASDLAMPGPRVNAVLSRLFGSEARIVSRTSLPVGVSLLAIGRRR
jgi:SAM-dependent methyltransferase